MPLIAYGLCSEVSTGHLFFSQPPYGRNVVLLRRYAFLASAIIAALVFPGDAGFKRRGLIWLPFVSMALTYWFYVEAAVFTGFFE